MEHVFGNPSDLAVGDLLVAVVVVAEDVTITPQQAGWTTIEHAGSVRHTQGAWWKIATQADIDLGAGNGFRFAWPFVIADSYGGLIRYSGTHATTPINASGQDSGTGTNPNAPSATTTVADTMVLRAYGLHQNRTPYQKPSVQYETVYLGTSCDSDQFLKASGFGFEKPQAAIGATGAIEMTQSQSTDWHGFTIVIRPA